MYRVSTAVDIPTGVVERYSCHEWEGIFIRHGHIKPDEIPLNYERVAEILADLHMKGDSHWIGPDGLYTIKVDEKVDVLPYEHSQVPHSRVKLIERDYAQHKADLNQALHEQLQEDAEALELEREADRRTIYDPPR